MDKKYSYPWYLKKFEEAKENAEIFILSVDEIQFSQPPTQKRWSIAECYSHLIHFGALYLKYMEPALVNATATTDNLNQSFRPRWIARKVISFFDPPYKIKVKTLKAMKPDTVSGYNRMKLLDEYINLQDQYITLLEDARHKHLDLTATKSRHPVFNFIKMTLSECFAIIEVHQRRHQWQAKQTLEFFANRSSV